MSSSLILKLKEQAERKKIKEQAERRLKLLEEKQREESESKDEEEDMARRLENLGQIRTRDINIDSKDDNESYITPQAANSDQGDTIDSEYDDESNITPESSNLSYSVGSEEGDTIDSEEPLIISPKPKKFKHLGFRETLKRKNKPKSNIPIPIDINICSDIFKNGSKVNSKYYFPSQFPNITTTRRIPTIKKGGKKSFKKRRNTNKSRKNKKRKKY